MTDEVHRSARHDVGVLLVGHGSKDARGVEEFLETARQVSIEAAPWMVEPCFLEFALPSIAEGFERLVAAGARHVVVAPVMLFAARHIRQDIPRDVALAAARFPGVTITQAAHLGCHEALVQLSRSRFDEALAGTSRLPAEATALVIVGRGSRDEESTREMLRFAELRQNATPAVLVRTAFLAMAEPRFEQVLDEVARSTVKRVVVQPHLLFAGTLLNRIRSLVDSCAGDFGHIDWHAAAHLGPAKPVVRAILQRAADAPATEVHPG